MTAKTDTASKIKLTKTAVERLTATDGNRSVFWDTDLTGFGVRVMASGTKTFFCQGRVKGELIRVTIGKFGDVTTEWARKEAQKYRGQFAADIDPRPEQADTDPSTFGNLMRGYVELLESEGKISARAVGNTITAAIEKPFPKLWKKPAAEVTQDDCMAIVDRLVDAGKPREGDKVRAYMKTAFTKAITSRGKARAPKALRNSKVTANPCFYIEKVEGSSASKGRALSLAEFRAYWLHIQALPEPKRSLAMLHVMTGGQRQQQLARVKLADIDRDAMTMLLWDGKGKRKKPRAHRVPLLPQALDLIDGITGSGEYVFSCNGGKTGFHTVYLNDIAKDVCAQMAEAGELEGEPFTAGTIRATIETRLMKRPYSVSSDVLAYLLSHGMGTVQRKHYQHDDFHEEKQAALEMLWRLVSGIPEPGQPLAQVVQMGARV